MPRGRSIDHSLAPTRSLINQRDYRARRAAKLKELEDAVTRLTAENAALRAEVAELRACVPSTYSLTAAQQGVIEAARSQLVTALRGLDSLEQVTAFVGGAPAAGTAGGVPSSPAPRASAPPPPPPPHFAPPPSAHVSDGGSGADATVPVSPALSAMTDLSGASYASSYVSQHQPSPHAVQQHQQQQQPQQQHQHTHGPRPGPAQPQLDPSCCGGLFDCSEMPGVQMSDMRSSWRQPPGPQQQQQQQAAPPPHLAPPQQQLGGAHSPGGVSPLVSPVISPTHQPAWYGGGGGGVVHGHSPQPFVHHPHAEANGHATQPQPQPQPHHHGPQAGPDELVPGGTGKCCMGVIDCGLLGVSDTE